MSRVTHPLLLLTAALVLASCQLKITSKNTKSGAQDPGQDQNFPPIQNDPSTDNPSPPSNPGDPTPGTPPSMEPGLWSAGGNGQVSVTRFAFSEPLAVLFTDSTGHGVPGATVTWKSSDTQGALNFTQTSSVTNSSGVATLAITAGSIGATESARLVTVTASVQSGGKTYSRVFYETVALAVPRAFFLKSAAVYTLPPSSTLNEALKVAIVASSGDRQGQPLPGVSLRVTPIIPQGSDPSQLPSVGCVGGTVLSNAQGEVACDLASGAQTGTVQISVSVGRFVTYDRSSAQVTH